MGARERGSQGAWERGSQVAKERWGVGAREPSFGRGVSMGFFTFPMARPLSNFDLDASN